ncbi:MAG: hypothetical protein M3Y84_04035 [Acidobacteriota bacterium]|nr:hypothetical protein [Acidobacteriota bacterium]
MHDRAAVYDAALQQYGAANAIPFRSSRRELYAACLKKLSPQEQLGRQRCMYLIMELLVSPHA